MIRRNYIATAEVSGATEDQVALAEELIDAYVGPQEGRRGLDRTGRVSASLDHKIIDDNPTSPLRVTAGTYTHCVIEIIGGAGVGQVRNIIASDPEDLSVSFEGEAFDPALDDTSVYKIYQLAKFPRHKDMKSINQQWYKTIPQQVREATRAQVQFIMEMGEEYFLGDDSEMSSESIGSYSYSRGSAGQDALVKMIAPKARVLLRGIVNRRGRIDTGGENVWPLWRHGPWL